MSGPRIERATAEDLASTSEEIAHRLESGDVCGASEAAVRLRTGVTDAINAGKVPEPYLEDLSGLANELEATIPPCVEPTSPPASPPPPSDSDEEDDDDEGRGNGKGKDKAKGKDKKDKDDR